MTDNKRIAKNTLYLYIRMFLTMGVGLFTSRIVLQKLGETDYGIFTIVGGVASLFTVLSSSLSGATSRFITVEIGRKDYIKLNKIFNIALVSHIVIAIVVIILTEVIGIWLLYNEMKIPADRLTAAFWVFQLSNLTMLFSLTQVPYDATIVAHEDIKIFAQVGIADTIIKLTIALLLYYAPFDKLIYYASLLCIHQVGKIIFYRLYCIKKYKETRINFCKEWGLYFSMIKYACADMIGCLSTMAQGQGLNLLLNIFFGPAVNAARGIAYTIQGIITQFGNNFMTAVRPQIIKNYATGNIKAMFKLVYRSSCFSFYLMLLLSIPACFETNYVLSLWLGQYPAHTIDFFKLIVILCLIQTIKTPRSTIYHATGNLKFVNITVGTILCTAFPLAYLFLKLGGGPNCVFWAANITMVMSEIASVFILKRYVDYSIIDYSKEVYGRCITVAAISIAVTYLLYDKFFEEGLLRVISTTLISTLSIATSALLFGVNKSDRTLLLKALKKVINEKLHRTK